MASSLLNLKCFQLPFNFDVDFFFLLSKNKQKQPHTGPFLGLRKLFLHSTTSQDWRFAYSLGTSDLSEEPGLKAYYLQTTSLDSGVKIIYFSGYSNDVQLGHYLGLHFASLVYPPEK